jgi:hypothetical protein
MGLKEIVKKTELVDVFKHTMGFMATMGLTNVVCDYIQGSDKLSDEKKKMYSDALRTATMTGNAVYYLTEKFGDSKEEYTMFQKTVITGVSSVAGGALAGVLSNYLGSRKAKAAEAPKQ